MLSLLLLPFRVPSQHSCFPNGLPHSATPQAKTPRQGRGWQEPAWSLSAEKGQSQRKTGPKEMEQVPGLGPEPQAKTRILRKMGVICRSERGREGGGEAGRGQRGSRKQPPRAAAVCLGGGRTWSPPGAGRPSLAGAPARALGLSSHGGGTSLDSWEAPDPHPTGRGCVCTRLQP